MRVENFTNIASSQKQTQQPNAKRSVEQAAVQENVAAGSASVVDISGQTLLRQRLFYCDSPGRELPMETVVNPQTRMQPAANFLTQADRQLLADIYGFSQHEDIDLVYVDGLAHSLSRYRSSDDGRIMAPLNTGSEYDLEGHKIYYSFTETDAATAKRIAESPESTQIFDSGFIRYITDKNHAAISHPSFDFLEYAIARLAPKGEQAPAIGNKFQQYQDIKNNFIKRLSKEVYKLHGDDKSSETQHSKGKGGVSVRTESPEDLQTVLRRIMAKYLAKSGLSTLFETIARLRR